MVIIDFSLELKLNYNWYDSNKNITYIKLKIILKNLEVFNEKKKKKF